MSSAGRDMSLLVQKKLNTATKDNANTEILQLTLVSTERPAPGNFLNAWRDHGCNTFLNYFLQQWSRLWRFLGRPRRRSRNLAVRRPCCPRLCIHAETDTSRTTADVTRGVLLILTLTSIMNITQHGFNASPAAKWQLPLS